MMTGAEHVFSVDDDWEYPIFFVKPPSKMDMWDDDSPDGMGWVACVGHGFVEE